MSLSSLMFSVSRLCHGGLVSSIILFYLLGTKAAILKAADALATGRLVGLSVEAQIYRCMWIPYGYCCRTDVDEEVEVVLPEESGQAPSLPSLSPERGCGGEPT